MESKHVLNMMQFNMKGKAHCDTLRPCFFILDFFVKQKTKLPLISLPLASYVDLRMCTYHLKKQVQEAHGRQRGSQAVQPMIRAPGWQIHIFSDSAKLNKNSYPQWYSSLKDRTRDNTVKANWKKINLHA